MKKMTAEIELNRILETMYSIQTIKKIKEIYK
jgi:hypothetical protein